jgi:hypothetical protein
MTSKRKTFEEWMAQVDAILIKRFGIESADLPDCCYADWYEDGFTPSQAVEMALEEGGF